MEALTSASADDMPPPGELIADDPFWRSPPGALRNTPQDRLSTRATPVAVNVIVDRCYPCGGCRTACHAPAHYRQRAAFGDHVTLGITADTDGAITGKAGKDRPGTGPRDRLRGRVFGPRSRDSPADHSWGSEPRTHSLLRHSSRLEMRVFKTSLTRLSFQPFPI